MPRPREIKDAEKRALKRWEDEERKRLLAKELARRAMEKEKEVRKSRGQWAPHDAQLAKDRQKRLESEIYQRMKQAELMAALERRALMKRRSKFRLGGPANVEDFSKGIADKFQPSSNRRRRDAR